MTPTDLTVKNMPWQTSLYFWHLTYNDNRHSRVCMPFSSTIFCQPISPTVRFSVVPLVRHLQRHTFPTSEEWAVGMNGAVVGELWALQHGINILVKEPIGPKAQWLYYQINWPFSHLLADGISMEEAPGRSTINFSLYWFMFWFFTIQWFYMTSLFLISSFWGKIIKKPALCETE